MLYLHTHIHTRYMMLLSRQQYSVRQQPLTWNWQRTTNQRLCVFKTQKKDLHLKAPHRLALHLAPQRPELHLKAAQLLYTLHTWQEMTERTQKHWDSDQMFPCMKQTDSVSCCCENKLLWMDRVTDSQLNSQSQSPSASCLTRGNMLENTEHINNMFYRKK